MFIGDFRNFIFGNVKGMRHLSEHVSVDDI